MSKPHGICIFCGLPRPMSKEDVFTQAAAKAYPPLFKDSFAQLSVGATTKEGPETLSREFRLRPSRPLPLIKTRSVCRVCNNEWMSGIVKDGTPLALQLSFGFWSHFDAPVLVRLASWATVQAITFEHVQDSGLSPQIVVTPQEERTHFMKTRTPPANWHIYVGRYGGTHWREYAEKGWFLPDDDASEAAPEQKQYRATFTLGDLIIHCLRMPVNRPIDGIRYGRLHGVHQIWPAAAPDFAQVPRVLSDEAVHFLHNGGGLHTMGTAIPTPHPPSATPR